MGYLLKFIKRVECSRIFGGEGMVGYVLKVINFWVWRFGFFFYVRGLVIYIIGCLVLGLL